MCASLLNCFFDAFDFVTAKIIHNDQISGIQRRNKFMLYVLEKHATVHGSREEFWDSCSVKPHGRDNRCSFRRIQWSTVFYTLFPLGSAIQTGQIRVDAAFIKKYQRESLHGTLHFAPHVAFCFYICPVPFAGMYHLFLYRSPSLLRRMLLISDFWMDRCMNSLISARVISGFSAINAFIFASLSGVTSDCLPMFS